MGPRFFFKKRGNSPYLFSDFTFFENQFIPTKTLPLHYRFEPCTYTGLGCMEGKEKKLQVCCSSRILWPYGLCSMRTKTRFTNSMTRIVILRERYIAKLQRLEHVKLDLHEHPRKKLLFFGIQESMYHLI